MAATTITDTGATITVTVGTQNPRNIQKIKIVELTIIKTNILKIDIGKGPLDNIFIPYPDVVAPPTPNPAALKDAVNQMLTVASSGGGSGTVGGATEAKQDQQNAILTQIYNLSGIIKNTVVSLDEKVFFQPLMEDESGPGIIYKGYALPGSNPEMPLWAIERIQNQAGVDVHTWAMGNRDLNKRWMDRETFSYL